jgi:hypothetical protein
VDNLLVRYKILTDRGAGFVNGNYINVYWDDVANSFKARKYADGNDTVGMIIIMGPDLGADRVDFNYKSTVAPIPYSFCDGNKLQTFRPKSLFPYAEKLSQDNHFSCATSSFVCDLAISDDFVIQEASDYVTGDGAITVTATSSNSTIKYSLDPNFDFSSSGQSTGVFTGLYPGTYTVTAKDDMGCIDQITVQVPVPSTYGVKYRMDYKDLYQVDSRVDILERGYSGSIIEVTGSDDPFILRQNGSGETYKFYPIMATEGILTLTSPSNFYFSDLFTPDDRKYQMRYYKDRGNTGSAFTPATLSALSTWSNLAGTRENWAAGVSRTVYSSSNLLYTAYTFTAGQQYTFNYSFSRKVSDNWTIYIACINSSFGPATVKSQRFLQFEYGSASLTGSFSFVAPSNAYGLAVSVTSGQGTTLTGLTLNTFTSATASTGGGALGYELKWLGYVLSDNYKEPYTKDPYPVTITATDGLADLKEYDFLDKDGNKFKDDIITLNGIAEILRKTDLGINIQTVINRYEEDMDQSVADDPLTQCKFPPETFYHDNKVMNCLEVLSELLKPFGGVIKQRLGKWFIFNPEELVAEANYREFTEYAAKVTNNTVEDIVDIDAAIMAERAVMEGGAQMLETVPAYGKLFFEHTLLKHDSLIKSHSFELDDTYAAADGTVLFKNWNVTIVNAPGAVFGIKKTQAFKGDYNFFVTNCDTRQLPASIGGRQVVLKSAPIDVEFENDDVFEFRFNYNVLLRWQDTELRGFTGRPPLWVRIAWKLQIGSYCFNVGTGGWTTDPAQALNFIRVDRYNEGLEFKIVAPFRDVPIVTTEEATVTFYLQSTSFRDITLATLPNLSTAQFPVDHVIKANDSDERGYTYYYRLGTSSEPSDEFDITPPDYNTTTNDKIWKLERRDKARMEILVDYFYIDDVILLHFPNGQEPPEDVTIERNNNPGIKVNFEESYFLNDVDIDNINNSERTYKNYFKKLDGTPTQVWERTYRTGTGKLLDLLSNDVVSQYKKPSNKITGSFLTDTEILPSTILQERNDGDKKYMFMGYELHDKHCKITFDIIEIKDVTDPDSDDLDAAFTIGFTGGFES